MALNMHSEYEAARLAYTRALSFPGPVGSLKAATISIIAATRSLRVVVDDACCGENAIRTTVPPLHIA